MNEIPKNNRGNDENIENNQNALKESINFAEFSLRQNTEQAELFDNNLDKIPENVEPIIEENRFLRTAHFNSSNDSSLKNNYNYSGNKDNNSQKIKEENIYHDRSYLKEMEDNMKLFELKMKKLEKHTNNSTNNTYNLEKLNSEREILHPNNIRSVQNSSLLEIEKLKNEVNYKNILIEELNIEIEKLKTSNIPNHEEKHANEIEYLKKEIKRKDSEFSKFFDENENLRKINDGIKREKAILRSNYLKTESENSLLTTKLSECENEKLKIERRLATEESQIKNLKMEYESMTKNLVKMKKQFESLTDRFEEFKADNYNLQQENADLKKKLFEAKNNNINLNVNINKTSTNNYKEQGDIFENYPNNYNSNNFLRNTSDKIFIKKKINNREEEVFYPSENKLKENINELNFIQQKLSELLKSKLMNENELLKLPEKPRTLNEINNKRKIEGSLGEIESEINNIKSRIRKLNGK